MQGKIAHFLFMGAQYRLQAAIHPLLGHFHPRQRQTDLIDVQRVNHPPARAQQRAGMESQLWRHQRAAEFCGQHGIKNHIVELGFAGQAERHVAVIHA